MDDDSLKRLWKNAGSNQKVEINSDKLIESVSKKLLNMEKLIKRRNRLEISLAVVMFFLFAWWVIVIPILAARIGSAIIAAACLLVIFKLVTARKVQKKDNTSDIKFELMVSLQLVRQEFDLLNTVLWWYLLPFFVGIILIFYAYLHSKLSFCIYSLIVALIYAYIWYKNKMVAKKYLKPLEENLVRILDELSTPE